VSARTDQDLRAAKKIYDESFFNTSQQSITENINSTWPEDAKKHAAYRNAVHRIKEIRLWKNAGTLLDIGCGKGIFVHAASRYFDAEGIDVSDYAVAEGRRFGLKLTSGDFREIDFDHHIFDVITMWDVLACFPQPLDIFQKVYNILSPGGLFVFTFPSASSAAFRLLGKRWPMMIPPINVSFYTRKSIFILADKGRFQILRFGYPGKWVESGFLRLKLARSLGIKKSPALKKSGPLSRPLHINLLDIATVFLMKK
jgi:SAM-dependent methyltransferase